MQTDASGPGTELIERLLLHWRVRCVLRRAPLEATSGPDAADLCTAVAAHLKPAWLAPPPALGRALRRWAAGVVAPEAARAALNCLAEIATELAGEVSAEFPPAGLGPVLEAIAVEADGLAAGRAPVVAEEADAAPAPPPWRDRRALERDVEMAVALGAVESRETALAVVQVDAARRRSLRAHHRRDEGDAVAPVAGILRLVVGTDALYRLGRGKLAVLVPGADSRGVGALMLRVTCASPRTRLSWGATSLGPAAGCTPGDADALVMLAEADLVLRQRDLVHARRALTHYRQRVGASVAAAVLLLAGVLAGTASLRPTSTAGPSEALPVGGAASPPPSVPAAQGPVAPAPAPPTPAPVPPPVSSVPAVPAPPQAQTVSAVVPAPPAAAPPPAPPPPPVKVNGSGKAPGTPGKPPSTGHGKGPTV